MGPDNVLSIPSVKPLLALLASALAIIPIVYFRRSANRREAWTLAAGAVKLAVIASMLPPVLAGQTLECELIEVLPGLPILLRVDRLGLLFALVAAPLWIITSLYSIGYMRELREHSQTRYFAFFALSLSATIGVAFAANLLTLYLFYEMLSLATYPLVTHHQDAAARSSGRKYLVYLLGTSVAFVLPAMIYTYMVTGTLDFSHGTNLSGQLSAGHGMILLLMFVFGFAKAGIMPFHSWLPGAMVAPTPVSALLHAVAVVKVGVFSILRIITGLFGRDAIQDWNLGTMVGWVAAVTVLIASLIALSQDNLKRRLAFSTIGQLSYIVLGAAMLSSRALTGSAMHIGMHAFGKITLFFCAGAIFVATGKKNVSELAGIGRQMPVTMTAFLIGSLSVIGLPPAGGFWSKLYLVWGTLEAEAYLMACVFLVSSFLNAAYLLPIVFNAFFCNRKDSLFDDGIREAPRWCVVSLVITAGASILLFFYPEPYFGLASMATAD